MRKLSSLGASAFLTLKAAYGEIDGYGVSLHVSIPQAIRLWKYPTSVEDISDIFRRHILGDLEAIPWSDEGLNAETETIREQLLKLIGKGWWSVASQPAVNGVKSTDSIFGWGPKNGYVFQKVMTLPRAWLLESLLTPRSHLSSSSSLRPIGRSCKPSSMNCRM